MLEILKPKIKWSAKDHAGKVVVGPLERGFGYTLGNSLRRVLLSSLQGAAITSVKIEGVTHEFSTIKGVVEDVLDILLNLKGIRLRMDIDEANLKLKVKATQDQEVKASDIKAPAGVEIVNPEHHIATLSKGAILEMTMRAEKGRGYTSAQQNKRPDDPIGTLPIDSIFSPVKRVTYRVENTRVGQRTDYDQLVLEVETDGTTSPIEAANLAAQILTEHFKLLTQAGEKTLELVFQVRGSEDASIYKTPIEQLDLSVRSYNCLRKNGIEAVEQLVRCSEKDLLKIRNFGQKSMEEIKEKLSRLGLSLGQVEE